MDLPEHLALNSTRSYRPLPVRLRPDGDWLGGGIIRELSSPVGPVLFGTYRDVVLWLVQVPSRRTEAFSSDALDLRRAELSRCEIPLELAPHLETLLGIYSATIESGTAGSACLSVASWAGLAGAQHTELEYTQAAALAAPSNPGYSLATAKLARSLAQYPRAESWFRRTIKLARGSKDHSNYVLAYLGLGTLYGRIGNGPAARATMERALRTARRWRLRELIGCAHHDLIAVWAEMGDLRRAYEHARNAQEHYESPTLLIRLAADVATLWARVGAPQRAIRIFETIVPHAPNEGLRAIWFAWLAFCAAACGLVEKYDKARELVFAAAAGSRDRWRNSEAAVIIAWSDLTLGEWERAAAAAHVALREGTRIGAAEVVLAAERARDDADERRHYGAAVESLEPPGLGRIADGIAGTLEEAVRR